jgi:hypothetical protein
MLWLETRGFYTKEIPPAEILARTEPTVLLRWSVPVTRGAATATLTGTTSYVPNAPVATAGAAGAEDGSFPWVGFLLWIVLLALIGGGATLWLRRRRDRHAPTRAVVSPRR